MQIRRVVFFEDGASPKQNVADDLRLQGYDVVHVSGVREGETEINHSEFEVLVVVAGSSETWSAWQKLIARYLHIPVLYVLNEKDPRVKELTVDDLHQVVPGTYGQQHLADTVDLLGRIGKLHRRIYELSQLASGSTSVDQMFTKLDVHHILDRVLSYFGARVDLQNLYWIRWTSLQHFLQTDLQSLTLEMDVTETRSPRLMSLHDNDLTRFFKLLGDTISVHELPERAQESYWTKRADNTCVLYVVVKSLNGGAPLGVLMFEGVDQTEQESIAPQISETVRLMTRFIEFGLSHWDSKKLAMIDDLTELYNQRFLPTVLDNEINRAERRSSAFTVLFMDLDYFKQVNDTKGHWIGSKLLKEVGEILKRSIRSCDYGFRYGGDEFVVILPDTDIPGGQIVAERIRKVIETTHFLIDGHDMRLTVSVGLAGYPHHALTREEIIQLADQAMYFGKRKSRNIVYVAS